MNIRNLLSAAFVSAGLDEADYRIQVLHETSIYVSIRANYANRSIHMILQTEDDNYVTDCVVSEETLSPVIGEDVYQRFIDRMMEETFVYV